MKRREWPCRSFACRPSMSSTTRLISAGSMRWCETSEIKTHDLEVEIMHACLVQDDVRKHREPVFDILYSAVANDFIFRGVVRFPECRLVDPIRLLIWSVPNRSRFASVMSSLT